jgi:alcohol dehydrogenase
MLKTKAAVLYEIGRPAPYRDSRPLHIEEVELADPGPRDVLIENKFAGLCHSDLSVINGSRPRPMPMVIGHEASGIVREVGAHVDDLAVGDHIVFSFMPACGCCVACANGRPVLCGEGASANAAGSLLSGKRHFSKSDSELNHHLGVSAFSQFTVAARQSVVKIDPELSLDVAAIFGCAVMTGVGAIFNTAQLRPGASCAVFGLGGVGLSAIMGARAAGAHPIIAVDILDSKLQIAKELGASHVVNASKDDAVEAIREITHGGADYTIEVVGSEKVLEQAYNASCRGGMTVTVGLPHPSKKFSIPAVSLVADEKTVKGSYMGSAVPPRDLPKFISMYQAGLLPVNKLLSSTIDLEDINAAFDILDSGEAVRQLVQFGADG